MTNDQLDMRMIAELRKDNMRLIAELRKDRERLDKLVNRTSRLTLVHWEDGTVTIFDDMTGNKLGVGNDLRDAIDSMEVKP
jgi:hypothetical protein